jgi:ABC-type sugar transport system permease subunit
MATITSERIVQPRSLAVRRAVARWLDREAVFSWLMMALPLLFLFALVGYPFIYGIWLSLENRPVAQPGTFVGLGNFIEDARDPVFWQVARTPLGRVGMPVDIASAVAFLASADAQWITGQVIIVSGGFTP